MSLTLDDGSVVVQSQYWKAGSNLTISYDAQGRPQIDAGGAPGAHVLADTTGLGSSHTTSGLTARQVLIATGATTALFRALVSADLPSHTHPQSDISDTPISVANGGTGLSTWTSVGRVIVSTGATAVATVDSGADGGFLRSNGTTWVRGTVASGDLPSHTHPQSDISDTPISVANGGTGRATLTDEAILVGQAAAAVSFLQLARGGLITSVSTTPPIIASILTVGSTGRFLRSDGSDISWQLIASGDLPSHTHTRSQISDLPWSVAQGGTGLSTWTSVGRVIVSTGATAVATVDSGADGGFLRSNGTTWVRGTVASGDLPSHTHNIADITGTPFNVNDGGTGLASLTSGSILVGAGTSDVTFIAPSATGIIRANTLGTAWETTTGSLNQFARWITGATNPVLAAVTLTQAMISDLPITWVNVSKTGSNLTDLATRAISDTTGTLLSGRGGTGQATFAADSVLVSNAANVWSIVSASGGTDLALTYNSGTGAITFEPFPTAAQHDINSGTFHSNFPLTLNNGGTGQSGWTGVGRLLVSATASTSTLLDSGADGGFARSNGTTWVRGTIASGDLPSHTHTRANISDWPLLVNQGGTGIATWVGIGRILVSTSATGAAVVDSGADGGFVRSNGTTWVRGTIAAGDLPSHSTTLLNAGTLGAVRGGTGVSSPTANRLLLTNGASAMTTISAGVSGQYLRANGTTWAGATLDMGDAGAGTLAINRGGTNRTSYTTDNVIIYNGTSLIHWTDKDNIVLLTGTQTISGNKTFSGTNTHSGNATFTGNVAGKFIDQGNKTGNYTVNWDSAVGQQVGLNAASIAVSIDAAGSNMDGGGWYALILNAVTSSRTFSFTATATIRWMTDAPDFTLAAGDIQAFTFWKLDSSNILAWASDEKTYPI